MRPPHTNGWVCFGTHALEPGFMDLWLKCQVQPHYKKKQRFIDLREHKERARVHFILDLKVWVS